MALPGSSLGDDRPQENRYMTWSLRPSMTLHTSGTVGLLGHYRVQGQLRGRIKGTKVGENNPPYGPCCQGGHSIRPQSALMPTTEHRQRDSVITNSAQREPCLFCSIQLPHSSTQNPCTASSQRRGDLNKHSRCWQRMWS